MARRPINSTYPLTGGASVLSNAASDGAAAVEPTLEPPLMRVLVLSAPVGAGHDVAAARVAAELRAQGHEVIVANGLELLGRGLERFVVRGYRFQISRLAWTWRILYAGSRSHRVVRMVGAGLARLGGRRLRRFVVDTGPSVIVSAYPLVSAALAALRRRGRLDVACATLITDFDPHPGWIHRDLDANLTVAADAGSARRVRPPVGELGQQHEQAVRERLGIAADQRMVVIVGGAWGVGNMSGAAAALVHSPGVRVVVVCGHNAALRKRLTGDPALAGALVLGYRDDLLALMAASDLVVQHAGGMTCLEAFALRVPIMMFDPVPGHGHANARSMVAAGLVSRADTPRELEALVADAAWWRDVAPASVQRASSLFTRPSITDRLSTLTPHRAEPRSMMRRAQTGVLAVVSLVALLSEPGRDIAVHAASLFRP